MLLPLAASCLVLAAAHQPAADPDTGFEPLSPLVLEPARPDAAEAPVDQTPREIALLFNDLVNADQLRRHHDLIASQPHDAGTPGDLAVIDSISRIFAEAGLAVEVQQLEIFLPRPIAAEVRVFAPDIASQDGLALPLRERPIEGDPFSAATDARDAWNAWSGSGDVTAPVVYANYGTPADFTKLAELGVDLTGKVVLCRYGKNFRGYKAKYAEAAGAAALLIYTDPADAGWGRGIAYGQGGGFANGSSIQRGSIKALDYPGDPLTPFEPSVAGTRRHNPETVGLPAIPVQPIAWNAATEILSRMTGPSVPSGFQGGLPFRYRLTGGDDLRVRVRVEQTRELVTTANVIGTLRGRGEPGRSVYVGCHHDAWGYGATDPGAGMICLLETARAFGELARQGIRPRRSIVFCAWAAEEPGIIGSTEFVESRARRIADDAVAYINLDMAATGPDFGASASPSLARVIASAAGDVPQAGDPSATVLETWLARSPGPNGLPAVGDLGGGSDHIGFLCHQCVPSMSLHAGGSPGSSYHTLYDNLAWYRSVVGDDYEPAVMVTRVAGGVLARLAHAPITPLDPGAYATAVVGHVRALKPSASIDRGMIDSTADALAQELGVNGSGLQAYGSHSLGLPVSSAAGLDAFATQRINDELAAIERAWCAGSFDDGRAWYRSGYAAPDATSGYAAWMLPGLRRALEIDDPKHFAQQADALRTWARNARSRIMAIDAIVRLNAQYIEQAGTDAPDEVNIGSVPVDTTIEPIQP